MAFYTALVVLVLFHFGLWRLQQVFGTIIWFIFATAKTGNYIIDPTDVNVIQDVILYHLKLAVFIEFLVNVYTFSLPVELILMPIAVLILSIKTLYEGAKESKVATQLQQIMGAGIMGYVIYRVISSYKGFFSINTAITFLIPFLLSIGFMPLLYLIALYASYEQIFTHINIATNKEKTKRYAKKEVLKHCHLNLKRAQGYAYGESPSFMKIYDKEDVDKIINS